MITFFNRKPNRYERIDETLSRSAQPNNRNLNWLKKHGVTDVIDLRRNDINIEKKNVEKRGMHYHNIPTDVYNPSEKSVGEFLDIVDGAKKNGKKVHIHDRSGSIRSEMYKYIYKGRGGFNNMMNSQEKMLLLMHNRRKQVPNLINWLNEFLIKLK